MAIVSGRVVRLTSADARAVTVHTLRSVAYEGCRAICAKPC